MKNRPTTSGQFSIPSVFRNLLCQLVVGVQEWQEQDISPLLHLCVDVVLLLTAQVAAADDEEGGVAVTCLGQGQPGVPEVRGWTSKILLR